MYPGLRPVPEKRIRRRMTKVAQLYAHAGQQIINLRGSGDVAGAACDAVVRRLCIVLWRFMGSNQKTKPRVQNELAQMTYYCLRN